MADDPSRGWDAIAHRFIAAKSDIGADVVRQWSKHVPRGSAVLDVGCGSGIPISRALVDEGFDVYGIDASPTLVAEFRRRLPSSHVVCEAAEKSPLFHRQFDAAVAIGLLFLLPADDQREVIQRIARALKPGGRFLFTAPRQECEWIDTLTQRESRSLGEQGYRSLLEASGMDFLHDYVDEGENYYFDAVRRSS